MNVVIFTLWAWKMSRLHLRVSQISCKRSIVDSITRFTIIIDTSIINIWMSLNKTGSGTNISLKLNFRE